MTEMTITSEYLPSEAEAPQDLVLLHGWGSGREIWRPLLAWLRPWANVTLLDLPMGAETAGVPVFTDIEVLVEAILASTPPKAVYVGWSLGGQVAERLCHRAPDRVVALVTLCCNPRFVGEQGWPGMPPGDFARFKAGVKNDPLRALRRFDSLQTAGATNPRERLRDIAKTRSGICPSALMAGLDWLGQLDTREDLKGLDLPQLHLYGTRDALVGSDVQRAVAELLSGLKGASVGALEEVSHVAPLGAAADIDGALRQFLTGAGKYREKEIDSVAPQESITRSGPVSQSLSAISGAASKSDVAESFSRAAQHYDSVAQLQRDVGTCLLEKIRDLTDQPDVVLDLGCGTGYFFPLLQERLPDAQYVGLDIAEGMVAYARGHNKGPSGQDRQGRWIVGDAENLPLPARSVDLIFSSLAIQWCHNPERLFAELARVLKPGGRCVFTSLGPDTLKELRSSWAAVDGHQHVNRFLPVATVQEAADSVPDVSLHLETERFIMRYDRVRELLTELKTLGAHNMNPGRQAGLTGRRALQGMLSAYEQWREDDKLPATYDVLFGVLEKL